MTEAELTMRSTLRRLERQAKDIERLVDLAITAAEEAERVSCEKEAQALANKWQAKASLAATGGKRQNYRYWRAKSLGANAAAAVIRARSKP